MTGQAGAAVIIPTYNEAAHIGPLLEQLLHEDRTVVGEILVADGRSEDATRAIVTRFAETHDRIRLVDNPDRLQSAGVNRAALIAHPDHAVLIRMDAHAAYAPNYVARVMNTLDQSEAHSVVVRLRTTGRTCIERAIAAATNSVFGAGGSVHRVGGKSQLVDHGHHAAFRRDAFETVGGYDTGFVANEDAEFDYRLRRAGGRIWFQADIEVEYYPRSTLRALARQYWRYGQGRAQNYLKHRERLRPRQMIPPAVVSLVACCILLGLFWRPAWLVPAAYAAGCIAASLVLAASTRSACALLACAVLPVIHVSWASGFIKVRYLSPRSDVKKRA